MTTSLSMVVEAAHADNANRIFRAITLPWDEPLDAAPDPGRTFSIPLSPDGTPRATHYGTLATGYVAQAVHDILLNGFPTGIDWPAWNLTENKASQAWNTIGFEAKESLDLQADWSSFLTGKSLKKVRT